MSKTDQIEDIMKRVSDDQRSILDIADDLESCPTFSFEMMGRTWKFQNLTGFSERTALDKKAKAYPKQAIHGSYHDSLLEGIEDEEKIAKYRQFLKTRQPDDWELAYRLQALAIEPKLSALEAISLTKGPSFVDTFNHYLDLTRTGIVYQAMIATVEKEKKDSEAT